MQLRLWKSGKRGLTGLHGHHRTGPKVARVSITCQTCGRVRDYLASFLKVHPTRFCSRHCAGQSQRKPSSQIAVSCAHCLVTFQKRRDHLKSLNFCSVRCAGLARRKERVKWPEKKRPASRIGIVVRRGDVDAMRRYHKAYRDQNRARINELQAHSRKRHRVQIGIRNRLRRYKGKIARANPDAVLAKVNAANGICVYCGLSAPRLEIDHIEAISAGGDSSLDNLMPCCRFCNASKSDKDHADWLADKHGLRGLARAVVFIEQGVVPEWLNESKADGE